MRTTALLFIKSVANTIRTVMGVIRGQKSIIDCKSRVRSVWADEKLETNENIRD